MPDKSDKDELLRRLLQEVEPDFKVINADHKRIMQLIAKIPEPIEAQKQPMREASQPPIREAIPPAEWRPPRSELLAKRPEKKANKNVLVWITSMVLGIALGVVTFLLTR